MLLWLGVAVEQMPDARCQLFYQTLYLGSFTLHPSLRGNCEETEGKVRDQDSNSLLLTKQLLCRGKFDSNFARHYLDHAHPFPTSNSNPRKQQEARRPIQAYNLTTKWLKAH